MFQIKMINSEGWEEPLDLIKSESFTEYSLISVGMEKSIRRAFIHLASDAIKDQQIEDRLEDVRNTVIRLLNTLKLDGEEVWEPIGQWIEKARRLIKDGYDDPENFLYDQLMGYGELISSYLFSQAISSNGYSATMLDNRDFLIGDSNYGDASLNREESEPLIKGLISRIENSDKQIVMQDRLASTSNGDSVILEDATIISEVLLHLSESI